MGGCVAKEKIDSAARSSSFDDSISARGTGQLGERI